MKEDINSEVAQSNGQILLHQEEFNPVTNHCIIIGFWEHLLLNDLKTPAEVYAALRDEGYNIEYRRMPLTREREPSAADVDAIRYCKNEYVFDILVLYRIESCVVGTLLVLLFSVLPGVIFLFRLQDMEGLHMQWLSNVLD